MRDGDASRRKGTASHSIESGDLVTPGQSFRLNSGANSFLKFFQWVAGYFANTSTTTQHAIAIEQAVNKAEKENASTMETHNIEPVVSASVEVATYNFHLNDSTITKTTNTVNFTGNSSDVKRQVDSTKNRNTVRNSNKEAWLRS